MSVHTANGDQPTAWPRPRPLQDFPRGIRRSIFDPFAPTNWDRSVGE